MNIRSSLIAAALLGCSLASASILVHEPFNYTVDANIGGVAATGTGLTGNWQRSFTDTATATLRTYTTSWTTPSGYNYTPLNKGIGTPVDQNNTAAVNLAAPAQINFDANGTLYYSYLLNYSNLDDRSRVSFGRSSSVDLMRVQGVASGALRAYAGTTTFNEGLALGTGTFLVVGRIDTVAAAGNDTNTIWVYSSSDTVPGTPGTAYTSAAAAVTGTANMLQFSNVINARYGDFRLGTTWEAVAIPEPSSLLLMVTALGGFALLRRRRVK